MIDLSGFASHGRQCRSVAHQDFVAGLLTAGPHLVADALFDLCGGVEAAVAIELEAEQRARDAPQRPGAKQHTGLDGLANDELDERRVRNPARDVESEARRARQHTAWSARFGCRDRPRAAVELVEGKAAPVGFARRRRFAFERLDTQDHRRVHADPADRSEFELVREARYGPRSCRCHS